MPTQEGAAPRIPRWLILVLGYGISVGCMVWVYRGFDWSEQLPRLLATNPSWIVVAVAFGLCTYIIEGLRWNLLLSQVGPSSRLRATQAIFIGLFANEVLPLRPGEVIRCYLMRRWTGLPLEVVFSSAAIERLLDGIFIVIGFFLVGHYVELPGFLVTGSRVLMVIIVLLTGLMTLAILNRRRADQLISASRWKDVLAHVITGVDAMGRSPMFLGVIALSFAFIFIQIIPIWALMQGFGLPVSFWSALVVFIVMRLGTIVPLSPGNAGPFQAATVLGLGLVGVEREAATSYATLLFFVITVPLWIAGFIALLATKMRLNEIHKDAQHLD